MKIIIKNLFLTVFLLTCQACWAQFQSPTETMSASNSSAALIRLSVANFREIITQLKASPINAQANAFNANYNNNKGKGSVSGCQFTATDLKILLTGPGSNPQQMLRINSRIFEENGRIYITYSSVKQEVTVSKSGTNYTLSWKTQSGTLTTIHNIVLSPFKTPCGTNSAEYLTVKGASLTDICGNAVTLKGVNVGTHNWGYGPLTNTNDIAEIKKTGANAIRLAWYAQPTDANQTLYSLQNLESVINMCAQNQIIAIVELHDVTTKNDANVFQNVVVNWWKRTDVIALIKRQEQNMIVNIANEYGYCLWAGNTPASKDAFENTYKNAVSQLRNAGIRVPIMIDAPDGGNSHEVLLERGQNLLASDPLKNIIFSVHAYWARFKYNFDANNNVTTTKPNYLATVQTQIQNIKNSNLCFIIGEVANQQDGNTMCQYDITDVYKTVLTTAQTNNIGWLAWMWHYDICTNRQMSNNNTSTNLSLFGQDIVNNTVYGLKLTSKPVKLTCP